MRMVSDLRGTGELADKLISAVLPAGMEGRTLVDLGCGAATRSRWIPASKKVFVDTDLGRVDKPPGMVDADIIEFMGRPDSDFDVSLCLDTIEHFDKDKGWELLKLVDKRTRYLSVFFTPLGEMGINLDVPGAHRSGWYPEEFESLGWSTIVFPKFHNPWYDGKVYGSFFAIRGASFGHAADAIFAEELLQGKVR